MKLKWITAAVIIFGTLLTFYSLQWAAVLKPVLILFCVILIGAVLLQAGKGGGLAAIGGLEDQSALGTQTGTVLNKFTYLIGASFIVTTILLTKLTLFSMHDTGTLRSAAGMIQETAQMFEDVEDHTGHDHSQGMHGQAAGEEVPVGMTAVEVSNESQEESNEVKSKPVVEEK